MVFAVVLALVLVALVGAWAWAHSAGASRLVRDQVLAATQDTFAGRLELGSVDFTGQTLELRGLKLFTPPPENQLVAEVAAVRAEIDLAALWRKTVKLDHVVVDTPALSLVNDERGLNLTRALAAKSAPLTTAAPAPAPSPLFVVVGAVELRDGHVEWADPARSVVLGGLNVRGRAAVHTQPLRVDADLTLAGAMTAPLAEPVSLAVTVTSSTAAAMNAAVKGSLGADQLEATGTWPDWSLQLKTLSLRSSTARAFWPQWPVGPTVTASADLTPTHSTADLRAGRGQVTVELTSARDFSAVPSFELQARELDPAELLGRGEPSRVSLSVKGAVDDVKALTGHLTVDGDWLAHAPSVGTATLAKVSLAANAKDGAVSVPRLAVTVPGLAVDVHGSLDREKLRVSGEATVTDLSKLPKALHEFTGGTLPPMAGSGRLSLQAAGAPTHPSLNVKGTVKSLRIANVSAEAVDLDAQVPDVLRPLDSDGVLTAKRLVVGESAVEEVRASLTTRGRELEAEVSTKGLGDVVVHLAGTLEPGAQGLSVTQLDLRSTEATWALDAPARVGWAPSLVVEPIRLHSGGQRLEVSATKRGSSLDAALAVHELDLAKLPRVVAPASLGLAGELTAMVKAKGRWPRPNVEATAALRRGAARGFDGIDLSATGAWHDQRATGQFTLATPLGRAGGTVDVDLNALADERPEPLAAHLEVLDVDSAKVAAFLKRPLPVTAKFAAQLEVSGTGASPNVRLTVDTPLLALKPTDAQGEVADQPALAVERLGLEVVTAARGELAATLSGTVLGGTARLHLATPFTVSGLRREVPNVAQLRATPVAVELDLKDVSLTELHRVGLVADESLEGHLAVSGRVTGTADAPRANLLVSLNDAQFGTVEHLHGVATVTADATSTTVAVTVQRQAAQVLKLDAAVHAPVEQWLYGSPEALGAQPVSLTATVSPLDLKSLLPPESAITGQAQAAAHLEGTLHSPRFSLTASAAGLSFSKTALGAASLDVQGDAHRTVASLTVGAGGRSELKVKGAVDADVSLDAVRRGLAWSKFPLEASAQAKDFDVAFLSGVTPMLRIVGGRLNLNATAKGSLGDPRLNGEIAWADGRLNLAHFGDYRAIALEAKASNDAISLTKLDVHSAAGQATVTLSAHRTAPRTWSLEAAGTTDHFPVVNDDQLVAIVTMKLALDGELSEKLLNINELSLPRVEVELPDVRRKNLQDLERPGDVFVMRQGQYSKRARAALHLSAPKAEEAPFTTRALLNAPRHVFVKSSDLDLELGLSDGFRVEVANGTQLFGEASVLRGKLSVIGRDFEVQPGSQVRFAGPATSPYVNVTAVYSNQKSADKTKVTVSVVGKGTDVSLKPSSDPPLTESEIYTLLATGRPTLTRGGGSSITPEQAASVIGSAVASQVKQAIAKKVPIDVLDFEATENWESARFNIGKYLTDTVFLGYSLNPGAQPQKGENPHSVKVELQMSRNWSAEASAGTAPAVDANFIWSRDF